MDLMDRSLSFGVFLLRKKERALLSSAPSPHPELKSRRKQVYFVKLQLEALLGQGNKFLMDRRHG